MQDGNPNPYQAPSADVALSTGEHGGGTFTIGQAWHEALQATRSHVGEWLLGGMLFTLLYLVIAVTVLGLFVGLPVMIWGGVYWVLRMSRGQSSGIGEMFEGFRRYGQVLGPSLLLLVLTLLLSMLGAVVQFGLALTGVDALAMLGTLLSQVWSAVITLRLAFAWFYLVDREMGAVDAMRASWEATGAQWQTLALMFLLMVPLYLVGFLALGVGVIVSAVISGFMMASAYRQTAGDPPPA